MPVEGPVASDRNTTLGGEGKRESRVTGMPAQANPYGQNNEQLPERLESALRRLLYQCSFESEGTRQQEVRRIKQAHQFWRGMQSLLERARPELTPAV